MSEDATFGSYAALPAPAASRAPRSRRPGKRIMAGAGVIAGAAVLLAAGAVLGTSFAGRSGPAGAGRSTAPATAAATFPAVPPGLTPSALPTGTSTQPKLEMSQPYGDGDTVYVVHGSGFVPLTQVQVRLIGHGVASFRPTVDLKGTFNYAIDQGHVFFPGAIPAGTYRVVVTGPRGRRATATFLVHPQQPQPPSGFPPPSGAPRLRGPESTTGLPGGSTRPGRSGGPGPRP